MKAVYIYPEDIGVDQWHERWVNLCVKLGAMDGNDIIQYAPPSLLLTHIQTNQ